MDFKGLILYLVSIVQGATNVAFALMILFFFWGLARYIFSASEVKNREAGKNIMLWGVIGIFVAFSIWGIIQLLSSVFTPSI